MKCGIVKGVLNLKQFGLLLIIFLTTAYQAGAQENSDAFIKKEKLVPPGTVLIGDGLYFDEAETANIHYLEFLYFAKKDSGRAYFVRHLPDTASVWPFSDKDVVIDPDGKVDSVGTAYKIILVRSNYLRNSYYRFYPVVGVSYSQANAYCKWRSKVVTDRVNKELEKKGKRYSVNYTYYLPTLDDYKTASDKNIPEAALKGNQLKQVKALALDFEPKQRFIMAGFKQDVPVTIRERQILLPGINFPGPVLMPEPNSKKLYNIYGNVAELTATKGITYGGAWIHKKENILKQPIVKYNFPAYWLGFRCACKVDVYDQ
jgi:formylglycine-generating enzyme required for sulfatase activity